ncbi:MAG TPA: YbaK/EbsC family protein [Clostridia bacterium]|nr:YbaK/EbsC family protein [Clostridia bacterium]
MKYHPVTEKIKSLLFENNCWFETFEHQPVRTSEESAKVRPEYALHQGAKALIVRIKKSNSDKRFVMLVFPANFRFNNHKVKALLGIKDIRFATEQEISSITQGIKPGGVPPFGNLFGLEVIADPKLFKNEKIVFSAGDRRFSLAMKAEDYRDLVKPQVACIV